MTKEQEAIERLENLVKLRKNKGGKIKYDNCICGTEDLETVLNMLKGKDKEIEKKEKLNKVLIDFIYKMSTIRPGTIMYDLKEDGFDTSKCGNCKGKSCKNCIKQYFENKAKE